MLMINILSAPFPGCEYGDKAGWCRSYVQSANECQNEKVAEQCCHSCKQYITHTLGNNYL